MQNAKQSSQRVDEMASVAEGQADGAGAFYLRLDELMEMSKDKKCICKGSAFVLQTS